MTNRLIEKWSKAGVLVNIPTELQDLYCLYFDYIANYCMYYKLASPTSDVILACAYRTNLKAINLTPFDFIQKVVKEYKEFTDKTSDLIPFNSIDMEVEFCKNFAAKMNGQCITFELTI